MKADITKFFEDAARRLDVSPDRLAEALNAFEDMTGPDFDRLFDETGIEIAELSALRAQLSLWRDPGTCQ